MLLLNASSGVTHKKFAQESECAGASIGLAGHCLKGFFLFVCLFTSALKHEQHLCLDTTLTPIEMLNLVIGRSAMN